MSLFSLLRVLRLDFQSTQDGIGKLGEKAAARYLKKHGYKILQRNYSCTLGEIDIVAMDHDEIVFVEVKSRVSDLFGSGAEAVTLTKQHKIATVAKFYLEEKRIQDTDCRFDVVSVFFAPDRRVLRTDLLTSAFVSPF